MTASRVVLGLGGLSGALGVAAGAYGAHGRCCMLLLYVAAGALAYLILV